MKAASILAPSLIALAINSHFALAAEQDTNKLKNIERVSVIGSKADLKTQAGSVAVVGELELEKFEFDDINRVLGQVPGVNLREEDGYGLRPNIGFRGVTPERSKKINILEDGILIGPAPYSAPAAYYFPQVSKMTQVEVTKGPSTIKYGPNTVAGSLNLITRPIPNGEEGGLDVALGTDGYQKAHGYYGNSQDGFGFVFEALDIKADGFKTLPTDGNTGFDKQDVMLKTNYAFDGLGGEQLIELKVAVADETSHETYLGLSDEDFANDPYQRYAASQKGKMDWAHEQVQLSHNFTNDVFSLSTRVYRHNFERAWFKVDGFVSSQGASVPSLLTILSNPNDEQNQAYYQVLKGERDSSVSEILQLSNNAREYYSQGIQFDATYDLNAFGLEHELEAGLRIHQDEIQRNHTLHRFLMRDATLTPTGEPVAKGATNTETATAYSVYLRDTLVWDALRVTAGVRGELIKGEYQNRLAGREGDFQDKTQRIWLPSLSAFYSLNDNAGVFAGVHRGFIPTSPVQPKAIEMEKSVNYELGYRYSGAVAEHSINADVIGFFSDYSNMKESCSISAGCNNTDVEFSAGEVDVYGIETALRGDYRVNAQYNLPWSVTYTHTQSEFKQSFYSDFNQWGFVTSGDAVPYLAENTFAASLGVSAANWQVNAMLRYTSDMPEAAQQQATGDVRDVALLGARTDSATIVDVSASYYINGQSQVYVKVDNLLDDQSIISRRPYGARPGKPRQLMLGYKYQF